MKAGINTRIAQFSMSSDEAFADFVTTSFGRDVAIAALSLKEGKLYPSPEVSGAEQDQADSQTREISHIDSIACLQYDDNGNFGLITLSGKD